MALLAAPGLLGARAVGWRDANWNSKSNGRNNMEQIHVYCRLCTQNCKVETIWQYGTNTTCILYIYCVQNTCKFSTQKSGISCWRDGSSVLYSWGRLNRAGENDWNKKTTNTLQFFVPFLGMVKTWPELKGYSWPNRAEKRSRIESLWITVFSGDRQGCTPILPYQYGKSLSLHCCWGTTNCPLILNPARSRIFRCT